MKFHEINSNPSEYLELINLLLELLFIYAELYVYL